MAKYFLYNPINTLLLAVMLFTSCNGQVNTNSPKNTKPTTELFSKIPKPRFINKEASFGCSIQDKEGNLWFGSNGDGLYCFNGKSFKNFTMNDGLDNNIVYSILEDKAGNIWVGTKTGLNRYTPSIAMSEGGKTFTHYPIVVTNNNNSSLINGVWSMMQDKKGTTWFGTDEGIYCYNGVYFTHFLDNKSIINKDSLKLKAIFAILEDKAGNVWFGSCVDEGISQFDGKNLSSIVPHKDIRRTNRIIEDKKGILWFAASFNGLCSYDPTQNIDSKAYSKNVFNSKIGYQCNVLESKAGTIWFDINEGLGIYDGKKLKTITVKDGLPNKNMFPMLEDKDGNLWLSSPLMGLYRYDGKTFSNFSE